MVRTKEYFRAQRKRILKNRIKFAKSFGLENHKGYAKHKVFDCRQTKCLLCHNGKTLTKRRFNKVTDADY